MSELPNRDELQVVEDVSKKLSELGIGYMLTGSMAMNYYAQPRMTRDIDIVIELWGPDATRIIKAFSGDYYVSPQAVWNAVANRSMFNVVHNHTIVKVDFIVRKTVDYRQIEFDRRQRVHIGNIETWIVSKEDLIISKMEWARESESDFQFRDIRNLVASGCDVAYIDQWTKELNLSHLWQRFRP